MNIKGKVVILRAMEREDCEMIKDMFNDPEIENLVVGWAFPVSIYAQEKWFEAQYKDNTSFRFVIETPEDGAVGIATLTNIDWKNGHATHGIKLAKKERRSKGIGTDTVMAIMRYAFDELHLNRLNGSWFPDNLPSRGMYMKCGWIEEGVRRQYIYKGGDYRDLVVVGILAEEYKTLIKKNHYWDDVQTENRGGISVK